MAKIELYVKFSGLFMFWKRPDRKEVVMLAPDARAPKRPNPPDRHLDKEEAEPHVGYVSIPLQHVLPGAGPTSTKNEAVLRLDRTQISFDPTPTGTLDMSGLDESRKPDGSLDHAGVADFAKIAPGRRVNRDFGRPNPPEGLLARLNIKAGTFHDHFADGKWVFSTQLGNGKPQDNYRPLKLIKILGWKSDVVLPEDDGDTSNPLKLTLEKFGGSERGMVDLHPVDGRIELTVGHLCHSNPLEWEEIRHKGDGSKDRDFKWLYTLLQDPHDIKDALNDYSLPIPVRPKGTQGGAEATCLPGGCT